jgi:hypothetical protein
MTPASALTSVKSYSTSMSFEKNGKPSMVATEELVRPSSIGVHMKNMEMIGIGNKAWMRMNGSAWTPTKLAIGQLASMDPKSFMPHNAKVTCTDAGMGLWHGQPAHIFKASSVNAKGTVSNMTMYVFPDGLPHHMDYSSTDGTSGTFDFSKFNATTVSPP